MIEDEETKPLKLSKFQKRRFIRLLKLPRVPTREQAAVLDEIEAAAQQYRSEVGAVLAKRFKSAELEGRILTIRWKTAYASKGAPRKVEMRRFVTTVALIHERVTGKKIKRSVVVGKDTLYEERPHPFLLACLKVVGFGSYPASLLR